MGACELAKQKDVRKSCRQSTKVMKRRNGRGRRDKKYSSETMETDTGRLCTGGWNTGGGFVIS
jgi:hypothetical protein